MRTNITPGAADNLTQRAGFVNNTNTYTDTHAITAGSFVIGTKYSIRFAGNTDFTTCGSTSNDVGTVFVATTVGSGTGIVSGVHNERQNLSKALTPKADN